MTPRFVATARGEGDANQIERWKRNAAAAALSAAFVCLNNRAGIPVRAKHLPRAVRLHLPSLHHSLPRRACLRAAPATARLALRSMAQLTSVSTLAYLPLRILCTRDGIR